MLKLRKLRILDAVAQCGTAIGAGAQVGLSQPAISRAIQSIERDVGTLLFVRSAGGAVPTPAGTALVTRFRRALWHLEQAEAELGVRGVLREQATDREFRALISIGETGSVAAAAAKEGLTATAIGRSLRTIERRTGCQLVQRTAGGVRLTISGESAVRRAKLAFAEIAHAMDDIAALANDAGGRLRIGALPLTRPRLVPYMVEPLLQRFPAAEISIFDGTYATLLASLRQGDIDLIVGTIRNPSQTPDIRSQVLFEDQLAVVARRDHPLVRRDEIRLEDCVTCDWVLPFKDVPLRMQFDAALADAGLSRTGRVLETDSMIVLRSLLLSSDRLAVVSRHQVLEEVRLGHLALLPLHTDTHPRPIGLMHLDTLLPTPLIAAAIDELTEAAARLERFD